MRFSALFFILLLTCLSVTQAQGSYEDCCLKTVGRLHKNTKRMMINYRRQEMDGSCNIPAIVFITKRGRLFCTDPKDVWVTDLMQKIDNKKAIKKSHQFRGPRRG